MFWLHYKINVVLNASGWWVPVGLNFSIFLVWIRSDFCQYQSEHNSGNSASILKNFVLIAMSFPVYTYCMFCSYWTPVGPTGLLGVPLSLTDCALALVIHSKILDFLDNSQKLIKIADFKILAPFWCMDSQTDRQTYSFKHWVILYNRVEWKL